MILTLCRRSVIIFIYLDLLMRFIAYFFSIFSISHFQWEGLFSKEIITTLIIVISIFIIIAFFIIITASILSKKSLLDREKASPFECGFDPFSNSRIPFSLRFYIIAIIFLVFDVEIAILLPLPLSTIIINFNLWGSVALIFIITLIVGLAHEWNFGALEWSQ